MTHTLSKTVSDETLSRIVQIESGGDPTIKARESSATGLGQFLNATWLAVVEKHRPDLLAGRSRAEVLELRKDPPTCLELLARFTEDNIAVIGAGATDGDIYLAHFAGAGTAKKLFRADADNPASSCFSAAAIKANRSILEGKTVGQVRAWAERKMAKAGGKNWIAKFIKTKPTRRAPPADDAPVKIEEPLPGDEAAPHGAQSIEIETIQRRLVALGYAVGTVDGKWGGMTAGGIAAFKNDRKMPGDPVIDDALKVELTKAEAEGFTRPIAKERAEAPPAEVAKKVETVQASRMSKVWAWVLGIPSAITAFVKGVGDNFEAALSSPWLNTIKEVAADNLLYIALGVVGVAAAIWWQSGKAEAAAVQAYREGRLP